MMSVTPTPEATGPRIAREAAADSHLRPATVANTDGTETHRILVVEDDLPLARFVGHGLRTDHCAVDLMHDGQEAAARLRTQTYDLLILDLNLPNLDGLSLLQQLRAAQSRMPVLVLTARSRTEDLVMTLDRGADDCLSKPFSLLELQARVRVLLRRSANAEPETAKAGGLLIDREQFRVERAGRKIELTPRELSILEYLVEHAGRPVSRATLMQEVWNVPFDPSTNIVDVYMKYLRDKLDTPGEEKLIRTIRGVGYVFGAA